MNGWKEREENDIEKMAREVASEPDEHSFTKGKENFRGSNCEWCQILQ